MSVDIKNSKFKIIDTEMTERLKVIESTWEMIVEGETEIDDEVIASIVGIAAKEVAGIADLGTSSIRRTITDVIGATEKRSRGVGVEAGKKEAILDIQVNVIYGFNIPSIVIELRRKVAIQLLELVGLIAKEINVDVVGIEFPDRMPGKVE